MAVVGHHMPRRHKDRQTENEMKHHQHPPSFPQTLWNILWIYPHNQLGSPWKENLVYRKLFAQRNANQWCKRFPQFNRKENNSPRQHLTSVAESVQCDSENKHDSTVWHYVSFSRTCNRLHHHWKIDLSRQSVRKQHQHVLSRKRKTENSQYYPQCPNLQNV